MESSDTGILSMSRDEGELAGGLVAELLVMLATDTAALALPAPQVSESSADLALVRDLGAVDFLQVIGSCQSSAHCGDLPAPQVSESSADLSLVRDLGAVDFLQVIGSCQSSAHCGDLPAPQVSESQLKRRAESMLDSCLVEGPCSRTASEPCQRI